MRAFLYKRFYDETADEIIRYGMTNLKEFPSLLVPSNAEHAARYEKAAQETWDMVARDCPKLLNHIVKVYEHSPYIRLADIEREFGRDARSGCKLLVEMRKTVMKNAGLPIGKD